MMVRIARRLSVALLAACLGLAGQARAADAGSQPTLRDIIEQQTNLRRQVIEGKGVFADMDRRTRVILAARQQRVIETLSGVSSLAGLRPDQRVQVFNDLEWIQATVIRAESDRKICEFVEAVGTHRRELVCTTERQQRERSRRTQERLQRAAACSAAGLDCFEG